jgi:hypothetical protein
MNAGWQGVRDKEKGWGPKKNHTSTGDVFDPKNDMARVAGMLSVILLSRPEGQKAGQVNGLRPAIHTFASHSLM